MPIFSPKRWVAFTIASGLALLASAVPTLAAMGVIATANGETLRGQLTDRFIQVLSPIAGQLTLATDQVTMVAIAPGRVELAGGDSLSGVIKNEVFHFDTDFASVAVPAANVKSLTVQGVERKTAPPANLVEIRLRNGDVVHGTLAVDDGAKASVGIQTVYSPVVNAALKEIADIKGEGDQYTISMRDGSHITGAITNAYFVVTTTYGELVLPRTAIAGFIFSK